MADKTLNLNVEQNSASLSITPAIYLRILKKAVEQTGQDLTRMETAIPTSDFAVLKEVTHKLKGDYDNLRITDLSDVARRMEEMARKEESNDVIFDLYNEFVHLFDQLKKIVAEKAGA